MTAPVAMPLISRGVPASTNDDFSGAFPATYGNDANYGNYWRCVTAPTGNANSGTLTQAVYLAYDLSSVPTGKRGNVVVIWHNDPSTGAYNAGYISNNYYNQPANYTIEGNAAAGGTYPTSGWLILATVTGNVYHSRQHAINLSGYNWLRINVTAINGSVSNNNVQLNMDVHDAHLGNQDNVLWLGDSITQRGFIFQDTTLEQQINNALPTRYPIWENGGIGGTASSDVATNISTWLALFSGKYVGLLYGTNDANNAGVGDPNFANTFYSNMSTAINAILAAGKVPIIPKTIPYGATTNLQANAPIINTKLAALFTAFPSVVQGPDLYAYFSANTSLIGGDGIHPTDPSGYTAYQNLWITWAKNTFYANTLAVFIGRKHAIGGVQ